MPDKELRVNRSTGWLICACLAIIVIAGMIGYWRYLVVFENTKADESRNLEAITTLKIQQIVQWQQERLADANVIAQNPFLQQALLEWIERPNDERLGNDWQTQLRLIVDQYGYALAFLTDRDGNPISAPDMTVAAETKRALESAIAIGGAVVSDIHLSDLHKGHLYIDIVASMGDLQGGVIGAVVLSVDADDHLFPLIHSWPVPNSSGEILVFTRAGDEVQFLSQGRFPGNNERLRGFSTDRSDMPAVQALLGTRGRFEGIDYRGEPVLANLQVLPNSKWSVLAKVDISPMKERALTNTSMVVVLLVLVALVSTYIVLSLFRRKETRLYEQLHIADVKNQDRENLVRIAGRIAHLGGWSVELPERTVNWSPEMFDIFELPRDDENSGFGKTFSFFSDASREYAGEILRRCIEDGTAFDEELEMTTQRGTRKWVRIIGEAVRGDGGSITRIQGAIQEITEKKKISEEIRAGRNQFQRTLDSLSEAVFVIDAKDRSILLCNRAATTVFGYEPWELIGQPTRVLHVDEESHQAFERMSEPVVSRGESFHGEFEMKKKDGTLIHTEHTVRSMTSDQGGSDRTVSVVRDITARKRAESDRASLQAQLLQSQKMEAIGRLAGGVAHDFNNMLNVILGYSDMALQNTNLPTQLRQDLLEIRSAAERSANLTQQLLAFSRQQTIALRTLDLNDVVASMLNMLGRLIGEDVELIWKPGYDLWQISADPTQIDQILANLVVNARDAINGVGKVIIETHNQVLDEVYCESHADAVPGEYVLLAISDNGAGMAQETLKLIFEPFFTTKEQGLGTGLGLATVYGIVRQNGGVINAYSEEGHGTTVKIYLPRSLGEKAGSGISERTRSARRGNETILLVEDEHALLLLGKRVLESLGYKVLSTTSPGEAVELAKNYEDEIHMVLTDVVMPEMDGQALWQILSALRSDLRVLFVSGYTADAIAHHGVLEEGVMFLEKPYTMASLAEKVRVVLDGESW